MILKKTRIAFFLFLSFLPFFCLFLIDFLTINPTFFLVKQPLKSREYQIKKGDTLFKIARQYGVSVEELKEANGITTNLIKEGKYLTIPEKNTILEFEQNATSVQAENLYIAIEIANVYSSFSTDSERVTQALHGEPVKVIEKRGKWLKVKLPEQYDYQGWLQEWTLKNISIEKSKVAHKIVSVATAKVFLQPNNDGKVLRKLPMGTVVTLKDTNPGSKFVLVKLVNGQEGYVLSEELLDYFEQKASQVSSQKILATARKLLGEPYLWGGMTTGGIDCSGFVHTVFKVHGIPLHRDVDLQYFNDGKWILPEELQPGDLVFFQTYTSGPSHIGIYVGNRKFIHASSTQGVSYSSLDSQYFLQRFLGAKRILSL